MSGCPSERCAGRDDRCGLFSMPPRCGVYCTASDANGVKRTTAQVPARPLSEVHTTAELDEVRRQDQERRGRMDDADGEPLNLDEIRRQAITRRTWAEENLPTGDRGRYSIAASTRVILILLDALEGKT